MRATDQSVLSGEIMTSDVISVRPETPVDEIAGILAENGISGVPVMGDNDVPVGIVSELDVISRQGATASDIMSEGLISVSEDTAAEDLVELLRSRRVRRVPVMRDGKMVGIISRSDLVRLFSVTRWSCSDCGYFERGFQRPEKCSQCGSKRISLDRDPPGM